MESLPVSPKTVSIVEKLIELLNQSFNDMKGKEFSDEHNSPVIEYALSCPLLLSEEQIENPYLVLESFFNNARLYEFQNDLRNWFKAALQENISHPDPGHLVFFHQQLTQLLEAAYLIGKRDQPHIKREPDGSRSPDFSQWLINSMNTNRESLGFRHLIHSLPEKYRENPRMYFREQMTLAQVILTRNGLQEWLSSALQENCSICEMEPSYIYPQYERLQNLIECCFLLIIEPVL